MLIWKDATQSKPKQGDRVLLRIADENCPVVGYWGTRYWEACTVNLTTEKDAYTPEGANIVEAFSQSDVMHYAEIGELPE